MSNTKKVILKESELVNLIDKIVSEAVSVKKSEWIAEQAEIGNKTPLLESQISDLQNKVERLLASKK